MRLCMCRRVHALVGRLGRCSDDSIDRRRLLGLEVLLMLLRGDNVVCGNGGGGGGSKRQGLRLGLRHA